MWHKPVVEASEITVSLISINYDMNVLGTAYPSQTFIAFVFNVDYFRSYKH